MKCLYWNTKNILSINEIVDLVDYVSPDFFFLSEIDIKVIKNGEKDLASLNYEHYPNPGCNRVYIIKRSAIKCRLNIQTSYYTCVYVENLKTYVISVHLPSQMFNSYPGLKNFIRNMRNEIDNKIGLSNNTRILIIGDFNVNPFETPMIDFDGFAATNSSKSRTQITNIGEIKQLYYNPTWKLYAENSFPGTKHFPRPSGSSFDVIEHHFLDQTVISKKLLDDTLNENISLIHKTSTKNYFDHHRNRIVISDHLPLLYEINIKN